MEEKFVLIELKDDNKVSINSSIFGQDLYEAYVALTAKVISELEDINNIECITNQAIEDAKSILEITKTVEVYS